MRVGAALGFISLLAGCGYVGDPLPPALNIPTPILDLSAEQVGGKMKLRFTIPPLTTEQLPVKNVSVDLQAGGVAVPVAATEPGPVEAETAIVPAWVGQEITFAVRLRNAKGRYSAWSNVVTRRASAPVPAPSGFKAAGAVEGVALRWSGPGEKWRVYRDGKPLADAAKSDYLDASAEYGKTYIYAVQALLGAAVSDLTAAETVNYIDTFAPAAPQRVSAIAGTNALEISWERSVESDLKHYRVWRNDAILAEAVDVPAYTDRTAETGKTYRYAVSAVDIRGNESPKSQPVEITTP